MEEKPIHTFRIKAVDVTFESPDRKAGRLVVRIRCRALKLPLEWHNKDRSFDRDLNQFSAPFRLRVESWLHLDIALRATGDLQAARQG